MAGGETRAGGERPGDPAGPSLTVGTAGHIDHGKTALVRALTGRDTDRLAEERRRGMSIELGYAELELDDGRRLSLVDVPGHERFVRTMIAGASGIDLFLLVVAADDGVMPQTREHLEVLRGLGVRDGIVALTKVDLVEEGAGRLEAVAAEVGELVPGAEIVSVSSPTGAGVDALRSRIGRLAACVDADRGEAGGGPGDEGAVLHVDRVFSVPGHGTVVTGTLWAGTLRRGDRVLVSPGGRAARIRSIESHDRSLEAVGPRRRVALNLAGVRREDVARGDVVTVPGSGLSPAYRLDAQLAAGAAAVLDERRVQVHHGTRESPARVVDLGDGAVQLRLEHPLLARRGDRVVIRRIAPPDTLGGATVLDPSPPRHSRRSGTPGSSSGPSGTETRRASADATPTADAAHAPAAHSAPTTDAAHARLAAHSAPTADAAHAPAAARSAPAAPGALARRVLAELEADGERPRTPARLAEDLGAERRQVEAAVGELVDAGAAVRFKAEVVYPAATAARLEAAVVALATEAGGSTSIGEVRDALGLSRKYAQAVLEHLDGERVLRRDGDRHRLRGGAT
ncbi:MAG TPA: selenocysteine-specific translation elongation factor [Solirubrobacterales bacterium]|nr:selenocysteine-specific translation elongation factor [Solirubrobacterales bacterium]